MFPVIPDAIKNLVAATRIEPNMVVADFGAGSGFVATELAKKVGQTGMVYAIDIMEPPLEVIRTEAATQRLFNIKTIESDLEQPKGSTLPNSSCDRIVISNLLFQVPDRQAIVNEAKRILKTGGTVTVVEWNQEAMPSTDHHPLSKDDVKKLFAEQRLSLVSEFVSDASHFGMLFKKE